MKIAIGIQARSNSTRLPGKVHKQILGVSILKKIWDECEHAAKFISRNRTGVECKPYILCPENDQQILENYGHLNIVTGPEEDVLTRYMNLLKQEKPDYIVRVTSDCYFIQSYIISRVIKSALKKRYHYTTNFIHRTEREGYDCEAISAKLFCYLDAVCKSAHHREHVTNYITERVLADSFPFKDFPFDICHIIDEYNCSHIHTSIDTEKDYIAAKQMAEKIENLKKLCEKSGDYSI